MAEYIEREAVRESACKDCTYRICVDGCAYPEPCEKLLAAFIEAEPASDVAPVVRCRECKHFNLQTHECENELLSTDHEGGASYSLNFYDDDFCSYGERRSDQ